MGRPAVWLGGDKEVVLDLPVPIEPLRHVRSTILIASLQNIRNAGYLDEYVRHLPGEHRPILFETIAGVWIPLEVAMAHYRAGDALQLAEATAVDFGKRSVERVGESTVGTAIRMARQAGATPWTFLPHIQRFWMRAYDGAGLAVYKIGPKDARLDLVRSPLCESPFYRRVLRGWMTNLTLLFCRTLYLHEIAPPDGPHSLSFRMQWV